MPDQKTHREVKVPQISLRYLADYMAASSQVRRTIIRGCKYQPIARVVQHDEAKIAVSRFIRSGMTDIASLESDAQHLRDRIADSEFDRDVLDHNADYIDRFIKIHSTLNLPAAEVLDPGKPIAMSINGTKVTAEIHFRLRRVTKTNKVRVGAAALRYAKGRPLPALVGEWQSAILFGLLGLSGGKEEAEPELKLCLTVDAHTGACHPAPTNSVSRFNNAEAECASIAERWANIQPPPGAVI
jgi:hypothetical protein